MTILSINSAEFQSQLSPIKPLNVESKDIHTSLPKTSTPTLDRKTTKKRGLDISPCELDPSIIAKADPEKCSAFNVKNWRNKSTEDALRKRYLNPDYVYRLLHEKFLPEYDNGRKPICNQKCCYGCQSKFWGKAEQLKTEMQH